MQRLEMLTCAENIICSRGRAVCLFSTLSYLTFIRLSIFPSYLNITMSIRLLIEQITILWVFIFLVRTRGIIRCTVYFDPLDYYHYFAKPLIRVLLKDQRHVRVHAILRVQKEQICYFCLYPYARMIKIRNHAFKMPERTHSPSPFKIILDINIEYYDTEWPESPN